MRSSTSLFGSLLFLLAALTTLPFESTTICDDPGATGATVDIVAKSNSSPRAIFNGQDIALAYYDRGRLEFASYDFNGNITGGPTDITAISGSPVIEWNGNGYGTFYILNNDTTGHWELWFWRLLPDGTPVNFARRITPLAADVNSAGRVQVVWNGSVFGVVWQDERVTDDRIYYTAVNANGTVAVNEVLLSDPSDDHQKPALLWDGNHFVVAWHSRSNPAKVFINRIDTAGNKVLSDITLLDSFVGGEGVLSFDGTNYGYLGLSDFPFEGMRFTRFNANGIILSDHIVADGIDLDDPSIFWTGKEYIAAWGGPDEDVQGVMISLFGTATGPPFIIERNQRFPNSTAVFSDGTTIGVLWNERDNRFTRYRRITCSCNDVDADGATTCWPDCDDTDPSVYPQAPELCDGLNNDCDSATWPLASPDEADADLDGVRICGGDCDDSIATIFPGATQLCDGLNNDCNDPTWPFAPADEADADGDGFAICAGDCDDNVFLIRPGGVEVCNARDDDCDGLTDETANGEDEDFDGITGMCDNCPTIANAPQQDSDGDSLGDPCDNCPTRSNIAQTDTDADSEGDACDEDDGTLYVRFSSNDSFEWQTEGLTSWNAYRGDLFELALSMTYTQAVGSNPLAAQLCDTATPIWNDGLPVAAGEVAFYLVADGSTGDLGTDSTGVVRPNTNPCP